MTFNPLAFTALASAVLLSACSTTPKQEQVADTPIIFTEPELSPAFYALNPADYDAPPAFELALKQAYAKNLHKLVIPITNHSKRDMHFASSVSSNELDVTDIDDLLQLVEGKARHYPPRFTVKRERTGLESRLRQVCAQLDPLADQSNASYDVLLRAFKAHVMARNLDLGKEHTTRSLTYAQRLIKLAPNDAEVNFWFGFSLSEGGGQKEALPYLQKAINAGYQEAYLSMANNYIALEQKKNALNILKTYKAKYPTEAAIADRLIAEIDRQGRWSVWQVLTKTSS